VTTTIDRIPVVLTGQALQSLRDSGFSLPAALAEVIDNSLEANANKIRIRFSETEQKRKKLIHQIVVADDGEGMAEDQLHHYLQLGYSTRYMSTKTIGKYGLGAKLAALNFGTRIDVWSRPETDQTWLHVFFDLDEALEQERRGEPTGIDPPTPSAIPDEFTGLLPSKSGTIVLWSNVDRLEEGRLAKDAASLRLDVEKELSRMFRNFIVGGIELWVDDTRLLPHDPLFVMENTWADKVIGDQLREQLAREDTAGAEKSSRRPAIPDHFPAQVIGKEPVKLGSSTATLTVTLYPREVLRRRGMGGDNFAKKLRVPENEGSISFVRMNREINYTNVPRIFPLGVTEADRFIGVEVSFDPELDAYFGVRNVKHGVVPQEELRDKIRHLLDRFIREAREKREETWGAASREAQEHSGEHAEIVQAAKEANRTLPKSRAKGPDTPEERQRVLDDLATDVGKEEDEDKEEYLEEIKDLPFVVESVDFPGNVFVDIQHLDGQVIIRLNTRHRFYREMWEPIKSIAGRDPGAVSGEEAVRAARRTIEALTLLFIAYGKAESMDDNPRDRYADIRMYWGQFLDSLMGKVRDVI
jgi:hypothetical protein